MARTTVKDGKKKGGKNAESGPVLVEDEPIVNQTAEQEDPDDSDEEPGPPPDARLIPRAGELAQQDFFAFIAQHPDPAWVDMYVHRLKPAVVNIPPPEWPEGKRFPTYCNKVKGLITDETGRVADWEWLRMVRGSGKYHLRLVDRRLKRTQNRLICESFIEINEYDAYPPILNDWRELVPCEENKWLIDKLLRSKIIKRTPEGGFVAYEEGTNTVTPAAATNPGQMLRETVNLAKDLAQTMTPKSAPAPLFTGKDIVDLIGKTQQANDPQKVIDAAKGLVEIAKPAADNNGGAVLTLITAQLTALQTELAAERAENRNLMNKMLDNATKQPASPLESVAANVELVDKIRGNSEGGAVVQSRMNGIQEFLKEPLTEFINLLKPLATVGAQVLMLKATQGNQAKPNPAPAPAPNPAPAVTAPATTTTAAAQQQPATPQQPQQTATSEPPPEMITPEQQQTQAEARAILTGLAYVMPTLTDYLADKELGGEAFAAWFCDCTLPTGIPILPKVQGFQAHQMIKKYSAENVVALVKTNSPAEMTAELIGAAGEKEEAFLEFIKQFQSYDPNQQEVEQPKGKKK